MDSAGRNHEKASSQDASGSYPSRGGGDRSTKVDEGFGRVPQFTEDLQDYDWEQLQERYTSAMAEHGQSEEDLRAQTAKLLEVFMAWSQTTVDRDENRALKRFKTQMQHVQKSEADLENKRKHYGEVVRAFQTALALLNDRVKP